MYIREAKKFGYVTTIKVFEEFKMKKDLEDQYKKIQIIKQTYLDSIKLNIQTLSLQNLREQELKIAQSKRAYLLKENQFAKENENLYESYNDQIWKQLNQFMEDYGKEKNYDYILGASGQGTLMFAEESNDITKEVIEYINLRYAGKKNH
jgi:outer membrane protein